MSALESEATENKKVTDLYGILQVSPDATEEEINEKYNELLKKYHPDKGGSVEKFIELKIAYRVLSDPEKRNRYKKSMASTFDELKSEYKNSDGSYKALPYEEPTEEAKEEYEKLKDKFNEMTDKKLVLTEGSFNKILSEKILNRDREIVSDDFLPNSNIAGELNKDNKFNLNSFNQMFEQYKESNSTGLIPIEELSSSNESKSLELTSYESYDRLDGIPMHNLRSDLNWDNTFSSKLTRDLDINLSNIDKSKNIIETKADEDFYKVLNERMKSYSHARENLLNEMTDRKFEYVINEIHNNPLSYDKFE